jgi:hypothetical protein
VEAILQAYMDETIEEHVVEEIKEQVIEDPNKSNNKNEPAQIISETNSKSEKTNEEAYKSKQLESDPITTILEQNKLETEIAFPKLSNDDDNILSSNSTSKLSFSDVDYAIDSNKNVQVVDAPKNLERLQEISEFRNTQRKMEEDDDDEIKLQIYDQDIELDNLDIHNIDFPEMKLEPDLLLNDIEVLA